MSKREIIYAMASRACSGPCKVCLRTARLQLEEVIQRAVRLAAAPLEKDAK